VRSTGRSSDSGCGSGPPGRTVLPFPPRPAPGAVGPQPRRPLAESVHARRGATRRGAGFFDRCRAPLSAAKPNQACRFSRYAVGGGHATAGRERPSARQPRRLAHGLQLRYPRAWCGSKLVAAPRSPAAAGGPIPAAPRGAHDDAGAWRIAARHRYPAGGGHATAGRERSSARRRRPVWRR
jgi:hypothetical protein